jgi:hypothetical protein
MCRVRRPPDQRVDREYIPRSTRVGAASRRVSGNARHETEDRTGTASVWNRADDVQTGPRRARENELSVSEIRRDVRSVDGRQFASPPPSAGGGDVDTNRDDITPRELGSYAEGAESRHLTHRRTGSPGTSSRPLRARSAMRRMQSASAQSHRKAVYDGFDAADAGTSGTSRHQYRPCLNIRFATSQSGFVSRRNGCAHSQPAEVGLIRSRECSRDCPYGAPNDASGANASQFV